MVVRGSNIALIGRNWLRSVKRNWKEMFQITTVEPSVKEILDNHKNVFKPIGPEDKIRDHKTNISIQPDSQPICFF